MHRLLAAIVFVGLLSGAATAHSAEPVEKKWYACVVQLAPPAGTIVLLVTPVFHTTKEYGSYSLWKEFEAADGLARFAPGHRSFSPINGKFLEGCYRYSSEAEAVTRRNQILGAKGYVVREIDWFPSQTPSSTKKTASLPPPVPSPTHPGPEKSAVNPAVANPAPKKLPVKPPAAPASKPDTYSAPAGKQCKTVKRSKAAFHWDKDRQVSESRIRTSGQQLCHASGGGFLVKNLFCEFEEFVWKCSAQVECSIGEQVCTTQGVGASEQ